jgi:hypothetical protein
VQLGPVGLPVGGAGDWSSVNLSAEPQPRRFHLSGPSDLRFNWVEADLAALDPEEAREFVVDAWRTVVPMKLSRAYGLAHPDGPG